MEQRMGFKDHTRYCPKCDMKIVDMQGDIRFCDCDYKEVYKTPPSPKIIFPGLISLIDSLFSVEIEIETLILQDFEKLLKGHINENL